MSEPKLSASHIMPRDRGAAPLDFVIAVMAFLAALALGSSLIASRAAEGWQKGLADRVTQARSFPQKAVMWRRTAAETSAH